MDAWWPKLVAAEFKPALGKKAFERLQGMLATGDHTGGSPDAPDFFDGWWGYVSKDLRTPLRPDARRPPTAASTAAAARSSAAARPCSAASREALKVTPAAMYGGGNGECAADPQPSCFDQNRPQVTSGIDLGPLPVPEPADLPAGGDA